MSFPFSSLVKVIYLLIRCYNTRFPLCNTNDTDRNGVNKQTFSSPLPLPLPLPPRTHTHTHTPTPNTQRKITLERVS